MSRPFTARFPGPCANECGAPIREGDLVKYVDRELVHDACVAREFTPTTVCGKCFMAVSVTGACGCEA